MPVEVSWSGQARAQVSLKGHPYFAYDDDPSVYAFPIGPREALTAALAAGLEGHPGPVDVQLHTDWVQGYLAWRVQRLVPIERAGYYSTVEIDPRTGTVLKSYRNGIGMRLDEAGL